MNIKIDITAGSLKNRIPESRVSGISGLTLTGTINGDDIEFLRNHSGGYHCVDIRKAGPLEVLDLSDCRIVPGGIYKRTDFMGPQKRYVGVRDFMKMWASTEFQGVNFGLRLTNADEISNEMFLKCYKPKVIYLPKGVKRIGDLAFYQCDNLTTIYIGSKLESIGDYVFANNYSLKEIHIKSETPPVLSEYAFGDPKYHSRPGMNPKSKILLVVPRGCSSDYWLQWGFDNVIEE